MNARRILMRFNTLIYTGAENESSKLIRAAQTKMVESTNDSTHESITHVTRRNRKKTEYTKLQAAMKSMEPSEDRSFGAMLGAFIGDSLGSYLEFHIGVMRKEWVDEGMEMPGGGPWGVAPG